MSIDRDPRTLAVLSWLREEAHENPAPALRRALDDIESTRQRGSRWPLWRFPLMNGYAKLVAAGAVAVAVAVLSIDLLEGPGIGEPPRPTIATTRSPAAVPSPRPAASASSLPGLGLPGMSPSEPAGEYGWTGLSLGSRGGMHRVVQTGSEYRQTQLVFQVEHDCFPRAAREEPTPVAIAGLDGLYVEPYQDPAVHFTSMHDGWTTGAYALSIADRTLCVYLTWDAATTPDELDAARRVVESIRGQPYGDAGVRINFTLPARWDTG